jgi:hypothetical protein
MLGPMSDATHHQGAERHRSTVGDVTRSPAVIRRFFVTFAITALLLLLPWPRWGRIFSALFSGYANVVVSVFVGGSDDTLRFSVPTAEARRRPEIGEWTVLLTANGGRQTDLDTRILGYTPLAVFAALVIATPVPRRRRAKIAAGGGAIVLARLACAIALPVARSLGERGPGWAFGTVPEVIWLALISPPAMSYVTAALGWWVALALTTRRKRGSDVRTGGDRRGSARTRASKRDRGKTSPGARGRPPVRGSRSRPSSSDSPA